jgi:CheY-like chemotaxis protein
MPRQRRSVLLVDDDPVVRLAVDRQLDALGWDAFAVNTGGEAIRLLELRIRFDVILIDLRLPDLEGPAVAEVVETLAPDARVLFMAAGTPLHRPNGPVLRKPFSTQALARALGESGGRQ